MAGPCGWTVDRCGCGVCWDGHTPATRARATALAGGLMWAATGRRFGACEVTVLPCNPARRADPLYKTYPMFSGGGYSPLDGGGRVALSGGEWRNLGCGGGCTCAAACEVPLPGPVGEVVEVLVDGVAVDPVEYEVHDWSMLVRKGGLCWPTCQVYGAEVPGFQVAYLLGLPIPDNVQAGFELLACQYAAACTGAECALPQRFASLSRQGVDLTIEQVDVEGGGKVRTGIQAVDDAIDSVNPHGLTQPPVIVSPDTAQPSRTVTWSAGS